MAVRLRHRAGLIEGVRRLVKSFGRTPRQICSDVVIAQGGINWLASFFRGQGIF